ncbi:MAG: PA14 domain-containing protein [Planctomycetota bacterium]
MPGSEGTFAWLTGEAVSYTNWHGGEPNDWGGGEDATHIRGDSQWNDDRAGSTIGNADGKNLPSAIEYELNTLDPNALPALDYRERKASGQFPGTTSGPEGPTQGQIRDLEDAELLLSVGAQNPWVASEKIGLADVINMLDSGGDGRFGDNDKPLIGGDQFVIEARGYVLIPSSGQWTFGTNTDDGSALWVGPNAKIDNVLSGAHDDLAPFTFADPGWYELRLLYFESGGGAEVELFAAPGSFDSWGDTDTWRLVGDVADGGLAVRPLPEPTTLALLGLGSALAALRRRRRTA